jgi:hypothetical protein
MPQLHPQPSIASDSRTKPYLRLINRLDTLDLSPLLVYRIDSTPASALGFLGWQFDILSPLWQLLVPRGSPSASATAANRVLVKQAIALHRVRGTPYALKTALSALGWSGAGVLEGQASWGGNNWPPSQGWAVLRIVIPVPELTALEAVAPWSAGDAYDPGQAVSYRSRYFYAVAPGPKPGIAPVYATADEVPDETLLQSADTLVTVGWLPLALIGGQLYRPVTANDETAIVQAFEFFKPARCWLDQAVFVLPAMADVLAAVADHIGIRDLLSAADLLTAALPPIADTISELPICDGWFLANAAITAANVKVGVVDGLQHP